MTKMPRQKMTKMPRYIFGACLRYRVAGSLGELGAGQATVTASRGAVTTTIRNFFRLGGSTAAKPVP